MQVKDAEVETMKERDAVLLNNPVMKERVIVMAVVMVASMMVTVGARETSSVGATTASSLVCITTQKTTVVRSQEQLHQQPQENPIPINH